LQEGGGPYFWTGRRGGRGEKKGILKYHAVGEGEWEMPIQHRTEAKFFEAPRTARVWKDLKGDSKAMGSGGMKKKSWRMNRRGLNRGGRGRELDASWGSCNRTWGEESETLAR